MISKLDFTRAIEKALDAYLLQSSTAGSASSAIKFNFSNGLVSVISDSPNVNRADHLIQGDLGSGNSLVEKVAFLAQPDCEQVRSVVNSFIEQCRTTEPAEVVILVTSFGHLLIREVQCCPVPFADNTGTRDFAGRPSNPSL